MGTCEEYPDGFMKTSNPTDPIGPVFKNSCGSHIIAPPNLGSAPLVSADNTRQLASSRFDSIERPDYLDNGVF